MIAFELFNLDCSGDAWSPPAMREPASRHSREFCTSSVNSTLRVDATQASQLQKSARAARRGFTLVEVLATMMLLAVILPAVMRGATIALSAASTARHRTEAANLAESKLNELVALGTWSSGGTGDFGPDHPEYHWAAATPGTRDYGVSDFTVTVTWNESGAQRSYVLATLMYDTSSTASSASSATGVTQ